MIQEVKFDSTGNPKQQEFLRTVIASLNRENDYRYFFYGGAIRGGKTYVCMASCILIACLYPKCKIHIIRNNTPNLKSTVEPTFNKICDSRLISKVNRSNGQFVYTFTNGSTIHMFGENFHNDPDLNRFKGLETNIFFLEQIEELRYETYQKAIERVGSWQLIGHKMPPPFIFSTFNPTSTWVRDEIHEPYLRGELPNTHYYLQALPTDNKHVTEDQWKAWANMDEISRLRFIDGRWDAMEPSKLFLWAFEPTKHIVRDSKIDYSLPIYLSFDFNVDPMSCIAVQTTKDFIRVIKEFRRDDANLYGFAEKDVLPFAKLFSQVFVTGDPAGSKRELLATAEHRNSFLIIQKILGISNRNMKILVAPLKHVDSRTLCNAVLQKHGNIAIDASCKNLLKDITSVVVNDDGGIDKSNPRLTHFLDCFRYFIQCTLNDFVPKYRFQQIFN